MVDKELVLSKASTIKHHCKRIRQKINVGVEVFLSDNDLQDIVVFNLQMAIQNCIDIAAHIVSEEGYGVPGSANDMFYMLEENGLMTAELVEKMVKAIGLRNLIVHEYGKINLNQVHQVAQKDLKDLETFIQSILKKVT